VNRNAKRVLFIVNRHAGIGYAPSLETLTMTTCEKYGATCKIAFTTHRGHATALAQEAAERGFGQVVAVGGDGTLNEVAQGLIPTGVPMGIIPRGSGNGLARHLGIPLRIPQALDQLFDTRVVAIDVFTVNGKLSLNVSGIGFDGHVTNLFGVKSGRGFLGYAILTVSEFLKFPEFSFEIAVAGSVHHRRAFIVAIANSSQYGNNARIAPSASVCDGQLLVNIVRKVPVFRLDFLISFFNGKLGKSTFCEFLETAALDLKSPSPIAYHVDGEPCGSSDTFHIRLIPSALRVLVPNHSGLI
jgi:YegS/Rv2252/BmrU family lipid kinase